MFSATSSLTNIFGPDGQPYPLPGTLEWQRWNKVRRIQRIQSERERNRLENLMLREIRSQSTESRRPSVINNNLNKVKSNIITKGPKAKPKNVEPQKGITKKSKSATSVGKESHKSRSATSIASKKGKKHTKNVAKSSSSVGKASRSSFKPASKTPTRKVSRQSTLSQRVRKKKSKAIVVSKKAAVPVTRNVEATPLKISTSKVKFSPKTAGPVGSNKDLYCPVTTPTSILKNRQKVDNLVKSSLPLSERGSVDTLSKGKVNPTAKKAKSTPAAATTAEFMNLLRETDAKVRPYGVPNIPQPNIPTCTAFPGTKAWEDYWRNFTVALDNYHREMTEYERKGTEMFREDLAFYKKQSQKMLMEREMRKRLGSAAVEAGMLAPPPITSKILKGLQFFNGYIMKSKQIKGTVSSLPGSDTGVRFEIDIQGAQPENVLIQKDHNLLTISIDSDKFLRIGTPNGKLAGDMEVWPPIGGIIVIDAP